MKKIMCVLGVILIILALVALIVFNYIVAYAVGYFLPATTSWLFYALFLLEISGAGVYLYVLWRKGKGIFDKVQKVCSIASYFIK